MVCLNKLLQNRVFGLKLEFVKMPNHTNPNILSLPTSSNRGSYIPHTLKVLGDIFLLNSFGGVFVALGFSTYLISFFVCMIKTCKLFEFNGGI